MFHQPITPQCKNHSGISRIIIFTTQTLMYGNPELVWLGYFPMTNRDSISSGTLRPVSAAKTPLQLSKQDISVEDVAVQILSFVIPQVIYADNSVTFNSSSVRPTIPMNTHSARGELQLHLCDFNRHLPYWVFKMWFAQSGRKVHNLPTNRTFYCDNFIVIFQWS